MEKKRDYKVIHIGFKTKQEYEKLHKQAVKKYGQESRKADCFYIRECIEKNKRLRRSSMQEKAKALIEIQTTVTELIRTADNPETRNMLLGVAKEEAKLWDC